MHEHAVEGDIAWLKTKGDRYVKIVEWSDEDNCFIGVTVHRGKQTTT